MRVELKGKKFSWKRLVNSFKYAFTGIKTAYLGEQNLRIHTIMAILVIICGFLFKISYMEWLVCLLLIASVLMAEFFNTAIVRLRLHL